MYNQINNKYSYLKIFIKKPVRNREITDNGKI